MLTGGERDRLDELSRQMKALDREVVAKSPPNVLAEAAARDLSMLEQLTHGTRQAGLVDAETKTAFAWLFNASPEDKARYGALVVEYNRILEAARTRGKAERERREAAAERALIRSAMCDRCFLIHRPNQEECE